MVVASEESTEQSTDHSIDQDLTKARQVHGKLGVGKVHSVLDRGKVPGGGHKDLVEVPTEALHEHAVPKNWVVLTKGAKEVCTKGALEVRGQLEVLARVIASEEKQEELKFAVVEESSQVLGAKVAKEVQALVELSGQELKTQKEGRRRPAAVPPTSRLQVLPSSGGRRTRRGRSHHFSTYLQHRTELTPDLHVTIAKSGWPACGHAKLAVTYRGTGRRGRTRWTTDTRRSCRSEARCTSDSVMYD